MKSSTLVLALGLVLGVPLVPGAGSTAWAETVETRQAAKVYAANRENSSVVARIKAGTEMQVLQRSGRWLKVRVAGRTGWVPRSVLAADDAAPTRERKESFVEGRATNEAKPKKKKKAPKDRIGADAVEGEEGFVDDEGSAEGSDDDDGASDDAPGGKAKPEDDADDAEATSSGDDDSEEDDDADKGDDDSGDDDDADKGDEDEDEDEDVAPYKYEKLGWRAGVGLGVERVSQNYSGQDAVELGSYSVKLDALALSLGGEAIYDYSKTYLIAGDLSYRFGRSSPGIRYDGVDTGVVMHDIDLGGSFGYKLSKKTGMAIYGRLGYHYGIFKVSSTTNFDETNPLRLPTEALSGVAIGGHLDIPQLYRKWAVRAGLDLMPILGKRTQTSGLEDGNSSSVFAAWLSARVVYDWFEHYKASAQLGYTYAKTSWSGEADGSMRLQQASSASRKDSTILIMVGLMRPF